MSAVAIQRAGVHVPAYRLASSTVEDFWGRAPHGVYRAVANWDEDAVTMAVEAGRRCLEGVDLKDVGTVVAASTTLPYSEKQAAALVAEALDLPGSTDTLDIASSPRAGTQALRVAADRVRSTGGRVLVIASDIRSTPAEDAAESTTGHAAVAFLLGFEGAATVRWKRSQCDTRLSHWRLSGDRYGHDADARFTSQQSVESLRLAVNYGVKSAVDDGATVSAVVISAPIARDALSAATASTMADGTSIVGPGLQGEVGYAGAAAPFLALAASLEQASEGDLLVWASLGDGWDCALVNVLDTTVFSTAVSDALAGHRSLSYARYLRLRDLLPTAPLVPYSSEIEQWRDVKYTARLQAGRCRGCGHIAYPPQPVCWSCHRHGDAEPYSLPRRGRLYTFTVEHLFPNAEGRQAMGVVELEEGVRFYAPIVDVPTDELEIGMPVRLAYRRLHQGGNFVNYFWKITRDREVNA